MAAASDRLVWPDTRLLGLLMSSRRKAISGQTGLSAADFARSVHCAEGTLRRYLRGERAIPVEVLGAWERVTGLVAGTLTGDANGTSTIWLVDQRPPIPDDARASSESFVGRRTELETIGELLQEATKAKRMLLVRGDPGIGKTRLVAAASRTAYDNGFTVLWGRCEEHLQLPFQPIAEALRPFVPNFAAFMPAEAVSSGLGGARWESLARQRMFEDCSDLLARIARHRPVLLALDDLHWAADSTVQLLRHLIVAKRSISVLVIATWNSAEVDPDGDRASDIADLAERDGVFELALDGLTSLDIEELVPGSHTAAQKHTLASVLQAETAGNPLLVRELLRDLAEQDTLDNPVIPARRPLRPSTRAVVTKRVARRSPATREALRVAAVIGTAFEFSILARVSSLPGGTAELIRLLDEARSARLVDENGPGRYQFVHNLIRRAISEQVSVTRRTLIHRDVADAIEAVHADDLDAYRPALAYHLSRATGSVPHDRVVNATIAAGQLDALI